MSPPLAPRLSRSALVAALLTVLASSAAAHAPHDVVLRVAVSPDFAQDRLVLAVAVLNDRKLLLRSTDAARSWTQYGRAVAGHDIRNFAFSPGFATDATVFAATENAGVWRSTDGGLTWAAVNTGITDLATRELSVAADGTLLVATDGGLFRSTDDGDNWTTITSGLTETALKAVGFAPDDADVAFVAGKTVHRSDDGGLTWAAQHTFGNRVQAVAVSPAFSTDSTLTVSFGRTGGGIETSVDGGASWAPSNTGITDLEIHDVDIAPDGTAFAVGSQEACFRAADATGPWTLFGQGFDALAPQTPDHYFSVATSPAFAQDDTVFVASFEGLYRSVDGGTTWQQSDVYTQRYNWRMAVSPDYDHDGLLFLGNYGGGPFVHRRGAPGWQVPAPSAGGGSSTAPGFGGTSNGSASAPAVVAPPHGDRERRPAPPLVPNHEWTALGEDVDTLYSSVLALSPDFARDRTIFYGFAGLFRSTDGGASWTELPILPLIPRIVAFSPEFATDRTLLLGSGKEGTWRSTDGGDTWSELTVGLPRDLRTNAIAVSPAFATDEIAYLASDVGVWRTTDGGDTWTDVSAGLPTGIVRALVLSPTFAADELVLAGLADTGLYRSDDGGDSWVSLNGGLPSGADNPIESLVFSPDFAVDDTVFVASLYDGVLRSLDGGWSWAPCAAGLPLDAARVLTISPDFARDDTLHLATQDWVWRSVDRGDCWSPVPGFVRVDDDHPTIVSTGPWLQVSPSGGFADTITLSNIADAARELQFRGDSVTWFATRDGESGMAEVFLDDVLVATVDLYSASAEFDVPVFTRGFGQVGWHTIRVRVTDTANAASTGTLVKSDGFEYRF